MGLVQVNGVLTSLFFVSCIHSQVLSPFTVSATQNGRNVEDVDVQASHQADNIHMQVGITAEVTVRGTFSTTQMQFLNYGTHCWLN